MTTTPPGSPRFKSLKILAGLAGLLACTLLLGCNSEPEELPISDPAALINTVNEAIVSRLESAVENNDFLLEKNLSQLHLVGTSLAALASGKSHLPEPPSQAALDRAARYFADLVASAEGGILELSEFSSLDTKPIVNRLPIAPSSLLLTGIDTYALRYANNNNSGDYKIGLRSMIFQQGSRFEATIKEAGGAPVYTHDADVELPGTYQIKIPASELNGQFKDHHPTRLKVTLKRTAGTGGETLIHEWTTILLPRFPVSYEITETYMKEKPDGETGTVSRSLTMDPVSKTGEQENRTITLNAPNGAKFDGPITQQIPDNTDAGKGEIILAGPTAYVRFWTRNDTRLEVVAIANWTKPTRIEADKPVHFQSNSAGNTHLQPGIHIAPLEEHHAFFHATFTYFNGKKIVLHSDKTSDGGFSATVSSSIDGRVNRLIVEIADPYQPTE